MTIQTTLSIDRIKTMANIMGRELERFPTPSRQQRLEMLARMFGYNEFGAFKNAASSQKITSNTLREASDDSLIEELARRRIPLYAAVHTHSDGVDVEIFATSRRAKAYRNGLARELLPREHPDEEFPADPDQAAETYFDVLGPERGESFNIQQKPLQPDPNGVANAGQGSERPDLPLQKDIARASQADEAVADHEPDGTPCHPIFEYGNGLSIQTARLRLPDHPAIEGEKKRGSDLDLCIEFQPTGPRIFFDDGQNPPQSVLIENSAGTPKFNLWSDDEGECDVIGLITPNGVVVLDEGNALPSARFYTSTMPNESVDPPNEL